MRYIKRLFCMLLVTLLLFPLLIWENGKGDMTFAVFSANEQWQLYHLDESINLSLLCEADNYISYENGAAAYVGHLDSARWDLIAEKNGEQTVLIEGTGHSHNFKALRLQLVDGNIYVPLHSITENNEVIDTPMLICSLDGTQQRTITNMNLNVFGLFHVEQEQIYYLEQDSWLPMVYDLNTGEKRALPAYDPISITTDTYMDGGRFWYAWADGNLLDYLEHRLDEIHIYLVGLSGETEEVIKIPFDEWLESCSYFVHDGWLYFFRDRRLSYYEDVADTVADLYRRNLKTLEEELVCTEVTYDENFPPTLTFGKQGIVYEDDVWKGEKKGYVQKFWYVPYDGSGKVELMLP